MKSNLINLMYLILCYQVTGC